MAMSTHTYFLRLFQIYKCRVYLQVSSLPIHAKDGDGDAAPSRNHPPIPGCVYAARPGDIHSTLAPKMDLFQTTLAPRMDLIWPE